MGSVSTLTVATISDLKVAPMSPDTLVLVVGKATMMDNLGGFYRWDSSSTADEDLDFLNVIKSSNSAAGRWVRVFQRAKVYPGGVLVNTGGVKTFYILGKTTDVAGLVTAYLTEDGTATGKPLFSTVWGTTGSASTLATSANDIVIGGQKLLSSDLKTLTYQFARGNSTVLGTTLSALIGLVVPGLRPPLSGTPVSILVYGV